MEPSKFSITKRIASQKRTFILLGLILSIAVFFNFKDIRKRGLINWDEPYYLTYAQFGMSAVKNLPFLVTQFTDGRLSVSEIEDRLEGRPPETAKPGHVALLTVFGFMSGGIKDYTGSLFSACMGVLTVLLVFSVGKRFFDERAGFASAAMLSVSPYFLMYSRSAMPETDASFFFLLGIFLYHLSTKKAFRPWLFYASGLSLGFALSINYRWFFMGPFILIFEVVRYGNAIKKKEYKKCAKRLLILFVGIITFPILFQLPYLVFGMFKPLPFPSYWEILTQSYMTQSFKGPAFYPHALFVKLFWFFSGPIGFFSLLGGVALCLFKHKLEQLLIIYPFAVPFVAFSLKTRGDKALALSIVLPFAALLSGYFLSFLSNKLSRLSRLEFCQNLVLPVLVLLAMIPQALVSKQMMEIRSGYGSALRWLVDRDAKKHFSTATSISNFYVGGRDRAKPLPKNVDEVISLTKEGYRYFLADWRNQDELSFLREKIDHDPVPVFSINNPLPKFWPYIVDDFHYRHSTPSFVSRIQERALDQILIFDLQKSIQNKPHL